MATWGGSFFHSPSSYLIEVVTSIHDYVMLFLFSTLWVVMLNLIFSYTIRRFSFRFYEGHELETVWTLVPFFLLSFILIPSLGSLYMLDTCLFCGMTVSIIGHQWYWSYFYKDSASNSFDSYILPSEARKVRLLDVDNRLIIPSFIPIRFLVSSSDVLHSWTVPSFGVKIDAVPGRINQFCSSSKRSGVFFGQCSEICGANHRFMPIVLESVPLKNISIII